MIDVDEKTGLAACTELQKEYSSKGVMFTRCDVTKPDELVSQSHGMVVSCPASLSHAEKESGETRIQFWFHTYVTYSDTGTMNVIISDGAITV